MESKLTKIKSIWKKSKFESPKGFYISLEKTTFIVISDDENIVYLNKLDKEFNNVFCISKKYIDFDESTESYKFNNIFKLIRISCPSGIYIDDETTGKNRFVFEKIVKVIG